MNKDFWVSLREKTRVGGKIGQGQCLEWCLDALQNKEVAANFQLRMAVLEEIQIDQLATSVLVHYWLEKEGFLADGTAGQYDPEYPEGYYGPSDAVPAILRDVYTLNRRD